MDISVIVPAVRWDSRLDDALSSVRLQELPPGLRMEIIVAVADDRESGSHPEYVRVVHNPRRNAAAGLNLAIANSQGDVVVRVDSRCVLPQHYIARLLDHLSDPSIGCAGGMQVVGDRGIIGTAYAVAFNSPLMGPSKYRFSTRAGPTESVYLGAWRRAVLDCVGRFDESLVRNQDNELSARIRAAGFKVWYDPDIRVLYYSDRSTRENARHHYEFGLWRVLQGMSGEAGLEPRHMISLAVVLACLGLGMYMFGAASRHGKLAMAGAAYGGLVLTGERLSTRCLSRLEMTPEPPPRSWIGTALSPLIAFIMDGAWASGVVVGQMRRALEMRVRDENPKGLRMPRIPRAAR